MEHIDRAMVERRLGRVRASLLTERWTARVIQIVAGLWLFVSAFLWPHAGPQRWIAIVGGLLIAAFSALAGLFPSLRALVGLACIWTFIATMMVPSHIATVFVNLYTLVLVVGLCMLPFSEATLWARFGEERRVV